MAEIKDGGPAFPELGNVGYNSDWQSENGMRLRDYFAATADIPWNAVIETLKLKGENSPTVARAAAYRAELKYLEADAMLAARTSPAARQEEAPPLPSEREG